MSERFDAGWLILREPFDQTARSFALARSFAECLSGRPHVVDLGAGTGSMFRFLAPIIGRGQDWTLLDADPALLDDAFGRTAAWSRARGFAAIAEGNSLQIATPGGLWRMNVMPSDLNAMDLPRCDGVVCSALLDLVSASWLHRLIGSLTVPFLAGLTVDGRDAWLPHHPLDAKVRSAFRRDQRRDKGLGPALGAAAPSAALRMFTASGFVTASAPSDWRIRRGGLGMQRALIEGTAAVVPGSALWQRARLRQALQGRLAISIGHRDILALPPGG